MLLLLSYTTFFFFCFYPNRILNSLVSLPERSMADTLKPFLESDLKYWPTLPSLLGELGHGPGVALRVNAPALWALAPQPPA